MILRLGRVLGRRERHQRALLAVHRHAHDASELAEDLAQVVRVYVAVWRIRQGTKRRVSNAIPLNKKLLACDANKKHTHRVRLSTRSANALDGLMADALLAPARGLAERERDDERETDRAMGRTGSAVTRGGADPRRRRRPEGGGDGRRLPSFAWFL